MKKLFIFIIFCLVAAAPCMVQAEDNGNQTSPEKEVTAPPPGQPVARAPEEQTERRQEPAQNTNWPRPFVPSEQITADSVVSFPIDI